MAVEPERSPYLNGTGGPKAAQDDVPPSSLPRKSASDGDMKDLPRSTTKPQGHVPFVSQLPKPSHPVQGASGPPSTTNSALSSREPSPSRSSHRPRNSSSTSTSRVSSRSRKRNIEPSPNRSATTSPSPGPGKFPPATTAQRGPSQPNIPLILSPPANVEPASDAPSPDKSNMLLWAGSRRSEPEPNQPNTSSKRTQPTGDEHATKSDRSAPRAVNRGVNGSGPALETVQEMASDQSTPSTDTILLQPTPEDTRLEKIDEDATPKALRLHHESGSDSGGNKSSEQLEENRRRPSFAANKPSNTVAPKRSSTSLSGGSRTKPADGSVRNMIVETETVTSIPQVSLGVGTGDRGSGRVDAGTLRMKPSTETIRPKKEKRRVRKPAPLTSGTASSKADIFEAKVASAVDEADVSDSDETFVYESNPPDQYPPRQNRYHSRTPSATSMASQVDQLAGRSRPPMRETNHSVTGKRSMKFTNNPYTSSVDGDVDEIPRSHARVDGNGTHTPRHHIGRHGRQVYPSLFDNDSPFPHSQGQKSPRHFIGSAFRQARQPGSRSSPNYRTMNSYKKAGDVYGYDFDAEGADDERTPLVASPRQTRGRGGRRPNSASLRQMEYMQQRHRSWFSRYGACVLISVLFLLLVGGGTSFIVAITKPLLDVKVLEIQNVLASEQELMLDLNVQAVNPNLFPVVIDDIDVNIFAKSRYVGTDKFWRDHDSDLTRFPRLERRRRADIARTARCADGLVCDNAAGLSDQLTHTQDGGVDKGTDPIPDDPAGDPQTMLIGRVFRLDSALTFEASPWNHAPSTSKGQIRLARPGNSTEKGGTERWERVLQHPFELIVGGVVQYQLPLSSRFHSASISSSIKVTPDGDVGDDDPDRTPGKNETAGVSTTKLYRQNLPNTGVPEGETLKAVRTLMTMTRRAFVA
ncbi:putative phospholipid metabolism enzyme regulator [Aspergillus lucknowensis]|uniref:Vacuolar segregation subunit 7-domain-containing protein n=1 Tax=Aspergillus lucknowensis TaxID=176173 RepID=A0ABR4M6R5_9EURO